MRSLSAACRPVAVLAALSAVVALGCQPGDVDITDRLALNVDAVGSSDAQGSACEPGHFYCSGQNAWRCRTDGAAYEPLECPGGCVDGKCGDQICAPGATRCQSSRTQMVCRPDGKGWRLEACPLFCDATRSQCADTTNCTPRETSCVDGGTLRTCKVDGSGFDDRRCEFGCRDGRCAAAACQPGDVRCNPAEGKGNEIETCRADQTGWKGTGSVCADECAAGACRTPSCQPGETFCDGGSIKTCNGAGDGVAGEEACEHGCSTIGAGPVCNLCTPNAVSCADEQTVVGCNDPTRGTEVLEICPATETCAAGECLSTLRFQTEWTREENFIQFLTYAGACWRAGPGPDNSNRVCSTMDSRDISGSFSRGDVCGWFCDNGAEADFSDFGGNSAGDLFDAASDICGCGGLFDGTNLDFKATGGDLLPGRAPGDYCLEYNVFLGDEVFLIECSEHIP